MMNNNIKLDLAYSIYRNIRSKNQYLDRQAKKEEFFVQCLIELMNIKKIEYLIVKNAYLIALEVEDIKFYFWIVEIPEAKQETEYVNYFCKELISIFYYP